jgi:hypothetical protein
MTDRSNHPQFEADDLANTKIQLANHSDPSLSPQENSAHSNRAKTIAKVLNSISIAAIIWGWFFPRPNKVVIVLLVGLPLTAIVLLAQSKGLYHIADYRGDRRPNLSAAFLGCGLVASYLALRDINILPLYWITALTFAMLVGCILTIIVVRADSRTREGTWAIIFLFATMYSYGAIAEVDTLLDSSVPKITQVPVLGKHRSSARGGTYWYLKVGKWGRLAPEQIHTPEAVFHVAQESQPRRTIGVLSRPVVNERESFEPRLCRFGCGTPRPSVARFADSPNWNYVASFR